MCFVNSFLTFHNLFPLYISHITKMNIKRRTFQNIFINPIEWFSDHNQRIIPFQTRESLIGPLPWV
jgi:hypothetical protein